MLYRVRVVSITEELVAHPVILQPTHINFEISSEELRLCAGQKAETPIAYSASDRKVIVQTQHSQWCVGQSPNWGATGSVARVNTCHRRPWKIVWNAYNRPWTWTIESDLFVKQQSSIQSGTCICEMSQFEPN